MFLLEKRALLSLQPKEVDTTWAVSRSLNPRFMTTISFFW